MQRGFGGTAFEPVEEQRDREVTIGPTMLTALVVALLALCGFCFVVGYAVGHSGSNTSQPAIAQPAVASSAQPSAAQAKPSAAQNGFDPQPEAAPDGSTTVPTETASVDGGQTADAPTTAPTQPAVHPALVSQPTAAQQTPATGINVQPALVSTTALMVQIAAVSHPEDAEVLVGALRKRGYTVAVRRDPNDSLLHVQIGPFTNRGDATAMRLKLLNDGYNAIIQP